MSLDHDDDLLVNVTESRHHKKGRASRMVIIPTLVLNHWGPQGAIGRHALTLNLHMYSRHLPGTSDSLARRAQTSVRPNYLAVTLVHSDRLQTLLASLPSVIIFKKNFPLSLLLR